MNNFKYTTSLLLVLALSGVSVLASIDSSPVKVTHRNSGPRYDIEEVERTRLTPPETTRELPSSPPAKERNEGPEEQDSPAMGHLSIRRIFLVPMMGPSPAQMPDNMWSRGSSSEAEGREPDAGMYNNRRPSEFGNNRPLFPFMHHMLGQDSASRSPSAETEMKQQDRHPSEFVDPIQMMIEMMQHALNSASINSPSPVGTDLNKEASEAKNKPENEENKPTTELSKPLKPLNETREDVVEIDGKKFMRKTIINRHVGENIIFMTKRLVFIPLNETSENDPSTTTTVADEATTATPSTTTTELPSTEAPSSTEKKIFEEITTPVASSTVSIDAQPSTTVKPVEDVEATTTITPTSTSSSKPEETTAEKEDKLEKEESEVIDKIVERILKPNEQPSS